MNKSISDIQKTKVIFNSILLSLLVFITHYFVLLIGGYNKKFSITDFIIFSVVFFVTTEIFIMTKKNPFNSFINFVFYIFIAIITTLPGSIIYSIYKEIHPYFVFSLSSIIFDCLCSYSISTYVTNSLIINTNTQKIHKTLKQEVKSSNVRVIAKTHNHQNALFITKSENLFINNADMANLIEKNALVDGLSSKGIISKISSDKKKLFNNIIQKYKADYYTELFIMDFKGNLVFTASKISNISKKCAFWNILIQYIFKNICNHSLEDLKNIGFYSQNTKYEVFKFGEYLAVGEKYQPFIANIKISKKFRIDSVVSELFKSINNNSLSTIEILAGDELFVFV